MRRPFPGGIFIVFAVLAIWFVPAQSRADDDPWVGTDKVIHYGVSAGLAAGGYTVGAFVFEPRAHALALGAGVAAVAGIGKELADLGGYGNASWKDLAWDGLGMVTGLAVAWGLDVLIRGISVARPAFAGDRGGIAF